jgi:phage-related protein
VKILAKGLMAMWEPIEPMVQSISDAFDGMNDQIEKLVQFSTDLGAILLKIGSVIKLVFGKDIFAPMFKGVTAVFSVIESGATAIIGRFTGILGMFGSAGGMVGKFAAGFGKVASVVKILGVAGKAIPFVGQVLTIIQAVWGFFSRVMGGMNVFDALGETLYDVFVSPFEMLFKLLTKIPVIGVIFEPILKIFPIIKTAIMDIFGLFKSAWNSLKEIFSGKDIVKNILNIGKAYLTGILFVPSLILRTITGIFPKMWESIKGFFSSVVDKIKGIFSGGGSGIGSMILNVLMLPIKMWIAYIKLVFVQIPKFIWTAITTVFTKISEWISSIDIFGGLWDGIKSLGSGIMGGITSAFGGAVSWVKGLFSGGGNDAGGMFSGIMDAIENIRTTITDTFKEIFTAIENTFSGLGETMVNIFNGVKSVVLTIIEPFQLIANVIQNIGDLLINNFFKGLTSIAQFIGGALSFPFKLIAKVVGVDTATVAPNESLDNNSADDVKSAIQETNRKLDTLIQLMSNGGIGVYLDGRKVSEQLAIASS